MPIARSTIAVGPAIIQFKGATFYSQSDITASLNRKTFEINTSSFGKADERPDEIEETISFTPDGQWESLGVLFPYFSALNGSSIYGADAPLVIWSNDGKKITYPACAVTKMPDITLAATKTLFGPVEFSAIRKDNTPWSTDLSMVKVEAAAYPGDATFDSASILTQPYTLAWGADAPWDSFETETGVTLSFDLSLKDITIDSVGIIDKRFDKLGVMAKFTPVGITEAQIVAASNIQGAGARRGASMSAAANDLIITGTGVYIKITRAALKSSGFRFGSSVLRIGECGLVATRTFTAGAADPLCLLATADPGA